MNLKNKKNIIYLISAVILVVIFVLLAIASTLSDLRSSQKPIPTPSKQIYTKPVVNYEPGSLGKSLIKLTTRQPLPPSDLDAKAKILTPLDNKSGVIFQNENFIIQYVESLDDFEIEINSKDIDLAKTEAENYLLNQGFSKNGLCNLPVRFYLGAFAANDFPRNSQFNPLPSGC